MAVNITYAICNNELIHISNRLSKENNYLCPFCKETLIARKGTIKAHHFAHKPDSSCSANEETMLHLLAKHFLIEEHSRIKLYFPLSFFTNTKGFFDTITSYMDIEYVPFEIGSIFRFYSFQIVFDGFLEKSIGNYVADVVFRDHFENQIEIVIEVFVTHSIEENKRNYFNQYEIPFIEVKPVLNGGHIQFFVTETNMNDFIQEKEQKLREELIEYAYKEFREELIDKIKSDILDAEKVRMHKSTALEQITHDIETLNLKEYIDRKLYKEMSYIPANAVPYFEEVVNVQNIIRYGKNLKVNNIFVNLEHGILETLIKNFLKEGIVIEAFVETSPSNSNYKRITGFNFTIPKTTITGKVMKDILKHMVARI